jgi:D-serine dehydratase
VNHWRFSLIQNREVVDEHSRQFWRCYQPALCKGGTHQVYAQTRLAVSTRHPLHVERSTGLGGGVGRALGVGWNLGVGVGLGVAIAVGVDVAVGVALSRPAFLRIKGVAHRHIGATT